MKFSRRSFLKALSAASAAGALGCGKLIPTSGAGGRKVEQATGMTLQDSEVDKWVRSVCSYCANGDPMHIGVKGGKVVAVKGVPNSPVNYGRLCVKGMTLPKVLGAKFRTVKPMIRKDPTTKGTNTGLEAVSWEEALNFVAKGLSGAAASGPNGVGFVAGGQIHTQAIYALSKLARAAFGSNNLDSTARMSNGPTMEALKASFGSDGTPGCFEDLDVADCFLIAGSNLADNHPSLFYRLADNRIRNKCTVIMVDPRKCSTAAAADIHLRPRRLGGDLAVIHAMANVIISEGLQNQAYIDRYVNGFADFKSFVGKFTPESAEAATGVPATAIREAARAFARAKAATSIYEAGITNTPGGAAKAIALNNLNLLTGHLGRRGAGVLALSGISNAMGVREVGFFPWGLPAGRELGNTGDRQFLSDNWRVPLDKIPDKSGLTLWDMVENAGQGVLKALVIWGANPITSLPNVPRTRNALRKPFVVVVDPFQTETTAYADVLLPAALSWGESEGCFTNSERRIQLLEKAVEPPGEAKADWQIVKLLAGKLGVGDRFAYNSPEDIWKEWITITRGTTFDQFGVTYPRLKSALGIQWPCRAETDPGTQRLGADGKFYAQRIGLAFRPNLIRAEGPGSFEGTDKDFPLQMTTGRVYEQFNTRTRTGKVAEIHFAMPRSLLEICSADAAARGLADGDWVELASKFGKVSTKIWITDRVLPGTVFLQMHYGTTSDQDGGTEGRKEPESGANLLNNGPFDFKAVGVRLTKLKI